MSLMHCRCEEGVVGRRSSLELKSQHASRPQLDDQIDLSASCFKPKMVEPRSWIHQVNLGAELRGRERIKVFEYGEPVTEGEAHIVWRRVGTYQVFTQP